MQELQKLDYERLEVYQAGLAFLALSIKIIAALPIGYASFADQLKRAALSITLNIAEGVGRRAIPDRQRFYSIARGSAMECGAILDAFNVIHLIDNEQFREGKTLIVRIVSMLTKM
jgi:four helix bundle protein